VCVCGFLAHVRVLVQRYQFTHTAMVKGRAGGVVFNGMCVFVCMSVVPLSSSVACDANIIDSVVDDSAGVGGDVTDSFDAVAVQSTSDVNSNGPNPSGVQSVLATSVPETVARSSSTSAAFKVCSLCFSDIY